MQKRKDFPTIGQSTKITYNHWIQGLLYLVKRKRRDKMISRLVLYGEKKKEIT